MAMDEARTSRRQVTLLIADRNPHIREFLRREMTDEGYRVCLARNGQELIERATRPEAFDLVILDPDLPDADEVPALKRLRESAPGLPIVVHAFPAEVRGEASEDALILFVEKRGASIENLKRTVLEILDRRGRNRAAQGQARAS